MIGSTFQAHSEIPVPAWLRQHGDDQSWGNDAMAHAFIWVAEGDYKGIEIWINYDALEDREVPEKWIVSLLESESHYHDDTGETLYQGDDESAAIAAVNAGLERLGSAIRI